MTLHIFLQWENLLIIGNLSCQNLIFFKDLHERVYIYAVTEKADLGYFGWKLIYAMMYFLYIEMRKFIAEDNTQ